MSKVHANQASIVRVDGIITAVAENQAFDENDPVVRAHPWLFASDVETATAAPGERRNVTRTKP